jgi:hypothetical protein
LVVPLEVVEKVKKGSLRAERSNLMCNETKRIEIAEPVPREARNPLLAMTKRGSSTPARDFGK